MVAVVDCTFGRAFVLVVVVVVGSVVVASAAYFAYGMIVTAVVGALVLRMDWGCGWELIELLIVAFVVVVVVFVIVV